LNRDRDSAVEVTAAENEDAKMWLDTQRRLIAMLQRAATSCFIERSQSVGEQQRRKYFCSSKTLIVSFMLMTSLHAISECLKN